MKSSGIQWTDNTFNPWIGCTKVSPGCNSCYAQTLDNLHKYTDSGWGKGKPRHRTQTWNDPIKWNRKCEISGKREKVFCASLADIMDEEVPNEWRIDLWYLIEKTPNLDWQLLTKRPHNYQTFLPRSWYLDGFPSNVWVGTSVEDQKRANERLPHLLNVPAAVRFISSEPLLERVTFDTWISELDWIIVGGESGSKYRKMDEDWVIDIRDQCEKAEVTFFFKQWSGFRPKELGNALQGEQYQHFPK